MPNFAMSGTADFSAIETKLHALQSQINSLKVPPIQVANPNFGSFFAACDAAEKKATINVKSVIEPPTTVGGGFSSFLNAEKGKFANVGREMGQSLQMGMTQQFGMAGGVASSLGGALGGVAIAGMAVVGGLALVGSAATQAAMKWEDMKTSIGRTTGLKGGDLEDLMSQLQDLRQEFGVTAQAASDMVEQAGSIGVGQSKLNVGDMSGYKQEIIDFTKSIAQIQGAWGMSAEATSSGIGKMGSVTLGAWNIQRKARGEEELSWADYAYKVGGTTDNLANAMGSSEEEIVTAMRNASGAVAKFAPSEETYGKWQAMASFLIDTGSSAGEAGTQIERVAQKMDQNSADIAKVMGIDQTSLSANLKTDFMGTVQDLGEAIAAMPESARPDTAKMFGLEGKVMIDKVVADIEAGTGKLQNAYDLALKPGNVAKGYEDVADNASKAFSRIGQAFQVSLERMGGQLLPVVTDIANAIADTWIAANEAGSKLFTKARENAAKSRIEVNSVGDLAKAAGIFLGVVEPDANEISAAEMGKQTASVYTDYVNQGIKAGNFDPITGKMKDVGKEAGAVSGAAFGQAYLDNMTELLKTNSPEVAMLLAAGMSTDDALIAAASQSGGQGRTKRTDQSMNILGSQYTLRQTETNNTQLSWWKGPKDTDWKAIESSGKGTSESIADAYYNDLKGSIKGSASFMETQYSGMSDDLGNVMADGIFEPMEKRQLEVYDKLLDIYKEEFPLEFGVEEAKLQADIKAAIIGPWEVDLKIDTGELETNFALWLSKNSDMYQGIYQATGAVPTEGEERKIHDVLKTASPRTQELYGYIDAASKGTIEDIEVIPEVIAELGNTSPELLILQGTTQRLDAAQKLYGDQVKISGNTFTVLDTNGTTLASSHLRTSVASDIAAGGLTAMAAAAYAASSALGRVGSGGTTGKQTWDLPYGSTKAATVTKASYLGWLQPGMLGYDLPKLAEGGKVTSGGLAWIGERGTEYVIPESEIKGLWPESAKVDMGSINYKPFLDYPAPEIRAPTSYMWSQFPNAPNVAEKNTDAIQTAWLSDNQLNSRDIYSGQIRDMQLASIGKSQVIPWFARGDIKQPPWWTEAATKLSPRYAGNWAADKGGTVPAIGKDTASSAISSIATKNGITVADAWSQLYGESFTEGCIKTNSPDDSLIFTPSASLISEIGRTWGQDATAAWNQLYGEAFTEGCIGTNSPDALLKYTPSASMLSEAARAQGGAWGSQLVGSAGASTGGEIESTLGNIEKNTAKSADKIGLAATYTGQMVAALKSPIQGFDNGNPFGKLSMSSTPGGALVTGLSKEGYLATYDPRTDTCEGLSFVAPDASLKTTDPFYLGLTQNSPFYSEDKAPGYGWENTAWTDNPALQQLQKISEQSYKEQQQTSKETSKVEKNTRELSSDMKASMSGKGYDASGALVAFGGGGGGGLGSLYGNTAGSYWGGTSVNGMGGWVGTGSSMSGWGAQASAAAQGGTGSGGNWGSVQWAQGGIIDQPTFGVFGEAGREAFVPISDRAAGLRILPQVMRELGVPMFAQGGITGYRSIHDTYAASSATPSIVYSPTINGVGLSMGELAMVLERDHKKLLKAVAKKDILARRRRG